ncbi:competence protein ComE [Bacillus manliponensis]|uniref:Competence protein ComE n=1 Tax=Bacillus manliponensis TaxID=574376 RepID=A0A073K169_9BACI|nr:ComEC/Rec2 family competence protein [Bacillus manliponensis]KEK21044.1 competence protein ComE [Bacillus manliponensis]
MKDVRIALFLCAYLLCILLNSESHMRYDASVHTVSSSLPRHTYTEKLKVSFLRVGQGDSTVITLPNGKVILIDGGQYEAGEVIIHKLIERDIKRIDVVIGTHPDMDHIGGLIPIIEQMPVALILDSGKTYNSFTYHTYRNSIKKRGIPFVRVTEGQYIPLDPHVAIQVLNNGKAKDENNESSIVLKIRYGKADFLFMGDADTYTEEEVMKQYDIHADVLKVGHHGSYTSTSEQFLKMASPQFAVISYGQKNPYGHPHLSVTKRIKRHGITIYTTAKKDIEFETDGEHLSIQGGTPLPLIK